jgi:uncharacterized lipoprotein YmbA
MKKVLMIVAMATLAACGGASTTATTDSTAKAVDTAAVTATDSTVAQIPADSTSTGGGSGLTRPGKAQPEYIK